MPPTGCESDADGAILDRPDRDHAGRAGSAGRLLSRRNLEPDDQSATFPDRRGYHRIPPGLEATTTSTDASE
jgi:hypothetical protein